MGACYRVAGVFGMACALSYASVSSPATLGTAAYNAAYKETLMHMGVMAALPVLLFMVVYDARIETLRDASRALWAGLAYAYAVAALLEIGVATVVWTAVLGLLEPESMARRVTRGDSPFKVAWLAMHAEPSKLVHALRRPRRTRFVADFLASCVAAPLIEEVIKLWAARRAPALLRRRQDKRLSKTTTTPQTTTTQTTTPPTTSPLPHVHAYLTYSLAAGMGFKVIDGARRIAAYTRPWHSQKLLFAAARGAFPIHELCAALTATRLARRDLDRARGRPSASLLRVVLPAALLHASAIFRGMKPAFKTATSAPWVELQLQAWNAPDDASFSQLCLKSTYSFMWWALLCRILGLACHEYYLLARHPLATTMTTTAAGTNPIIGGGRGRRRGKDQHHDPFLGGAAPDDHARRRTTAPLVINNNYPHRTEGGFHKGTGRPPL